MLHEDPNRKVELESKTISSVRSYTSSSMPSNIEELSALEPPKLVTVLLDSNLPVERLPSESSRSGIFAIASSVIHRLSHSYVIGNFKEAIQGISELKDQFEPLSDPAKLERQLKAKLVVALGLSEAVGTYLAAPVLGAALQYVSGNPVLGIVGTIVGDYIPAVCVFLGTWLYLNRDHYGSLEGSSLKKIREFLQDTLPLLGVGAAASAVLYPLDFALSYGSLKALSWFSSTAGELTPSSAYTIIFNITCCEALYMGTAAAFMTEYAKRLTSNFLRVQFDTHPKNES